MRIVSKKLTFFYSKDTNFQTPALKDVDLVVNEGDFFGVIGHTGSGKSTLIQHLNAIIPVQDGELSVGEYDLKYRTAKEYKRYREEYNIPREEKRISKKEYGKKMYKLRSKVGMVFQYPEYQLFGETVFEDISFGIKNFFPNYEKDRIAQMVYRALELVGLEPKEVVNKSPFELSGGQKRRVAIAGVIVTKPEILVLDEPVAGLDPVGKKELMDLLHVLHDTWCKTIVIISHDMDDIAENCNRVAVMKNGELVLTESPSVLFKKSEELKEMRLDVPLTAYLTEELKKVGAEIDNDFTVESFCNAFSEYYKNNRGGRQ